jgi:hypothetical protein
MPDADLDSMTIMMEASHKPVIGQFLRLDFFMSRQKPV